MEEAKSTEELEATWRTLTSTNRRFKDRVSGGTLLKVNNWCARGPDRKLWPDQDVRMKMIENGMLLEFQPNELCCGWECLKGTPEEADLRLEGSKTDRFRDFFIGSDLDALRDFGEKQFRRFMIKYQDWLLPLLDEEEEKEFTSKIDGVIEFLSDKMQIKDTLVYMNSRACGNGFKGSLVFVYTKDDGSPALLLLAHGVVSEDDLIYMYTGHCPYAYNIDTDAAESETEFDSDSDDNADAEESEEDDDDNYIYTGDPANDVDTSLALARNMDTDADNDSAPYDPRCGPPFPPERMDPYVGSLVVTYVDSDEESNKEDLDAEYIADMESSKEAPGAFYYIQATISSVDFNADASKKRRVD